MSNEISREGMGNMGTPSLPPSFQNPQNPPMGGMQPEATMPMEIPQEPMMPQTGMPQMQMPMMGMQSPYAMPMQMPYECPCQDMQHMYSPFMYYPVQSTEDGENMTSQLFRHHRDFDNYRFRPYFPYRQYHYDYDNLFPFLFFDFYSPYRRYWY